MGFDRKDLEMMAVSIPTVDFMDIREDLERLTDVVDRLERVLEAFIMLYHEERVKNWEMILQAMLRKREEKQGNRNASGPR